ncbi:DUF3427 domain-containing protein [uncultured Thiothrix sp.]|uniref:DUF3427 domain-containing protein n=1 Tax=uncultured Thiothrix sp. TaxID=223185 RepID=UPI00261C65B4|nr:DUF3427 domain-containing protein [uncultured Thiothrix sp.]HMT91597.1 DUF3427 domain-containing protein [Thiolinea sp.]
MKSGASQLISGLYDLIVTETQQKRLETLEFKHVSLEALDTQSSPQRLADLVKQQLTLVLQDLEGNDEEKLIHQLTLVNRLLIELRTVNSKTTDLIDVVAEPARLLKGIYQQNTKYLAPELGLSQPWLFTAGKDAPALLHELRHELANCDQVDILVSFITVSGVRRLFDILQSITAIDAHGQARTQLRILTTTYTGATDQKALDELARLPSCMVKVSLDGRRTRLHAKAWIFKRKTGFGSAYVGSANLSGAALLGGLEWTTKFTEHGQAELFTRAQAHFETLWEDGEFQVYDPHNDEHRQALKAALARESGSQTLIATRTFFDIQPKPYQQEMLEQLQHERAQGRFKNLVVAATGTGKTVIAAFDYRVLCNQQGGRPRLLFVAHREEILKQALRTYREVLRDASFGGLLVGGHEPDSFEHLFVTIDSLTSRQLVKQQGANYWHTVVIDECHHLVATRFDHFVKSIQPAILLGLTATPERSDGQPILSYFDKRPDGNPAVELRLWQALDLQILTPFEYFACDDQTDFTQVPWQQTGELKALNNLVTGNDVRARLIINEWRRLTANPRTCKALVFCVSIVHAEFMTAKFNAAGLPAECIVSSTTSEQRRTAPQRLASGELCALVTVDLYNEGVDLPLVDTLLLLRPTQSSVVFQQQIGRGLRLAPGKETCLVLDFVGQHRKEFRFDKLLSSLTGQTRYELKKSVENGFASLPAGCHIQLHKHAREQILQSLRALTQQSWRHLIRELQAFVVLHSCKQLALAEFLHEQMIDVDEIYREIKPSGWVSLKRDAGFLTDAEITEEAYFSQNFRYLLHIDDPVQLALLQRVAKEQGIYQINSTEERLRLQMLAYQVDGQQTRIGSYEQFLARLQVNPSSCFELAELAELLQAKSVVQYQTIGGLGDLPLCLHAAYSVREILTAVGWLTAEKRPPFQAGVLALPERKTELHFVTLDKSSGYHASIAYHDYAISRELFHWQTQNSVGINTKTGRRYLESPENGWSFQLFVRRNKFSAYRACGAVILEEITGEKPMNIRSRLQTPLSLRLFREFSVLGAS